MSFLNFENMRKKKQQTRVKYKNWDFFASKGPPFIPEFLKKKVHKDCKIKFLFLNEEKVCNRVCKTFFNAKLGATNIYQIGLSNISP